MIVGNIILNNNTEPAHPNNPWGNLDEVADAAIITAIAGGLTLSSIPFFVGSSRKKKKANLLLKKQQVIIAPRLKSNLDLYQIGIAVNF